MRTIARLLLPVAVVVAGCSGSGTQPIPAWTTAPISGPVAAARVVTVYRSPTCSCCHEWEAYMTSHGWTVQAREVSDITLVKREHGLPEATWSCHTAVIDGYVVEGHVPVTAIEALLLQRPDIDGIALPGMPAGSPGMPGSKAAPFAVLAIDAGAATAFGAY